MSSLGTSPSPSHFFTGNGSPMIKLTFGENGIGKPKTPLIKLGFKNKTNKQKGVNKQTSKSDMKMSAKKYRRGQWAFEKKIPPKVRQSYFVFP